MRKKYRNGDPIGLAHHACDDCNPAMIAGTLCHEVGCPSAWKDHLTSCFICGDDFYPKECRQTCCNLCLRNQ